MQRNQKIWAISTILIAAGAGAAYAYFRFRKHQYPPLNVYPQVDLEKYLGEWYEFARIPFKYEKSCYNTKANYTLNSDGSIKVVNTCNKASLDGELEVAEGKAFVVDETSNAKLKVQFQWPFRGDYWILDVGKDYEYALVGSPSRENLWILSRSPKINGNSLRKLKSIAIREGFDVDKLIYTQHTEASKPVLREEAAVE